MSKPTGLCKAARTFAPKLSETALLPHQVAAAYNFPTGVDVSKRTVAILELGGAFANKDVIAYCTQNNYKQPRLSTIVLPGAEEVAGDADGEVSLDIDVIAGVAQGAHIVVVFAPNTEDGFIAGMQKCFDLNPDAVSISWGAPENSWTATGRAGLDALFKQAAESGINVFCASGDNGSNDGTGSPVTDYPACSPYVIACGGTKLELNADGTRGSETAWSTSLFDGSGSGGGASGVYPVPGYQAKTAAAASYTNRTSPDISGNADPNTGYQISIDGTASQVGGTSAVAPLYAALNLLVNAKLGRKAGLWNRQIYSNPSVCFDVVEGTNGAYKAVPGYDLVTGNGVVNGADLVTLFDVGV